MNRWILFAFAITFIASSTISFASTTYDSGTNIMIYTGNSSTCFADIVADDLANDTWNCTSFNPPNQYNFTCALQVGDDSGLPDINPIRSSCNNTQLQISFSVGMDSKITVSSNSVFQYGLLDNATTKETSKGVQQINNWDWNNYYKADLDCKASYGWQSYCYVYSSKFDNIAPAYGKDNLYWGSINIGGLGNVYHTQVDNGWYTSSNANNNIFDVIASNGGYLCAYPCQGKMDKLYSWNTIWTLYSFVGLTINSSNIYSRNTKIFFRKFPLYNDNYNDFVIDADTDNWVVGWLNATGYSKCNELTKPKVFRQNTIQIQVVNESGEPIENANVSFYSHLANPKSYLTDSNGIVSTLLNITWNNCSDAVYNTRGTYEYETDLDTFNSTYSFNPYNIVITKDNFQTLNFTTNITEKTNWKEVLDENETSGTSLNNILVKQWVNTSTISIPATWISQNFSIQENSTPNTCSAFWGGTGNTTYCNLTLNDASMGCDGTRLGSYEHVEEVYINASAFLFNNPINVTCQFYEVNRSGYFSSSEYLWYFNGTNWTQIYYNYSKFEEAGTQLSGKSVNRSFVFNVNSTEGTHTVRCNINYRYNTTDFCHASASSYDADDVNLTVVNNDTGWYNWTVNTTTSSYNATKADLSVWVFNGFSANKTLNISIDSAFGSWYLVNNISTNSSNTTVFSKNFTRNSTEYDVTVGVPNANTSWTGNPLRFVVPSNMSSSSFPSTLYKVCTSTGRCFYIDLNNDYIYLIKDNILSRIS